jgi:hypothetical protein
VRRAEVRTLEEQGTQREEHSVRAAEEPWNLTDIEKTKLTELPKMNKRLYSAYLLKESFAAILDRRQPNVVLMKLEVDIVGHALGPQALRQGRERLPSISTASLPTLQQGCRMRARKSTNGKVRTITRRSYGLHGASALIALIHLCCSDLNLQPVHVRPRFHQTKPN